MYYFIVPCAKYVLFFVSRMRKPSLRILLSIALGLHFPIEGFSVHLDVRPVVSPRRLSQAHAKTVKSKRINYAAESIVKNATEITHFSIENLLRTIPELHESA